MLPKRKFARDYLEQIDRPKFLEIVYKAKVTPRQKEFLYARFLDGLNNYRIAMEDNVSVETVRDDLRSAYDKIYNYLLSAKL